jgi:ATP-binding cassette subfamily F protein uup
MSTTVLHFSDWECIVKIFLKFHKRNFVYTGKMSDLISCQSLSKSFGTRLLFEDLTFSIYEGDQIGLIGLNGCGKSTLLKILAGLDTPDTGNVVRKRGLKVGYLPQECEFSDMSPKEILLEALDDEPLAEMWLSKLGFTGDEPSASLLSGGWKKRLGLARELILSPDLILLDEPTNHLDLNGILWLEQFLAREAPPYLLVSHDRYFLQNACKRVLEIDPTYPRGIFVVDGPYSEFLEKKEVFLAGQLQQERSLATKMRRETAWLRQGVKARTTKSRSRIDQAHEILEAHSQIRARNRKTTTKIDFEATERETRKLISVNNLSKTQGNKLLFQHLDFLLSPGTRIGLMGANGSGKTTLLRILAGELAPDVGTVKKVDDLKIVYFDQHRAELPKNISLKEALSPDGDYVLFRGQRIHVNGWCKRFLFSPDILAMPIGQLSGGERARISIARLILCPADILLLDEPTNDLDIPTLEALEESLLDFPGAVVLISHDRCMIDRICNSLLALGDPEEVHFFADLSQWESSLKEPLKSKEKKEVPPPQKAKLSYSEKREYEAIDGTIAALEEEVRLLNIRLEDPLLAEDPKALTEVCKAIALAETQIERAYLRWHELDDKNIKF